GSVLGASLCRLRGGRDRSFVLNAPSLHAARRVHRNEHSTQATAALASSPSRKRRRQACEQNHRSSPSWRSCAAGGSTTIALQTGSRRSLRMTTRNRRTGWAAPRSIRTPTGSVVAAVSADATASVSRISPAELAPVTREATYTVLPQ